MPVVQMEVQRFPEGGQSLHKTKDRGQRCRHRRLDGVQTRGQIG